jgi:hypothetical protein
VDWPLASSWKKIDKKVRRISFHVYTIQITSNIYKKCKKIMKYQPYLEATLQRHLIQNPPMRRN